MWRMLSTVLLVSAALAGCATSSAPYPADLAVRLEVYSASQACCDDPSAFSFQQLPPAGTLDVTVGSSSPAFEFQSGPSRFVALRLPDTGEPFRIRVKSYFDGPPPDGSVFYPVLAVMNEAFIVTRMSNLDNLRLDQGLVVPGDSGGLALTMPFDPQLSPERYLIVFTPAILLGAAPLERRDGDLLTTPTITWMERRGAGLVPPSPFGRLRITIAPATPPGSG